MRVPGIIIPKAQLDRFKTFVGHQAQYGFADSPDGPNAEALRSLATASEDRLVIRDPDAQRLLLISVASLGFIDFDGLTIENKKTVASVVGGSVLAAEIDGVVSPPLPMEAATVGLALGYYLMPVAAQIIR